ncbi:MAG: 50S ribosomal protein L11 methyltransferase [Pyrinomonadaceae bacterium]|nr:50S ribosomal protein L11 methyltransferase [Pyrinomonadaceae bacterium]
MSDNTQQSWYALEITAEPEAAEALEFAFNELDALGTEINHLRRKATDTVTVAGYFADQLDDAVVDASLADSLAIYGFTPDVIHSKEWRRYGQTDWLYDWKKHWKPTVIGNFIVSPPWEEVSDAEKHIIWIEPNMAFGTGTHDTTQLCLRAIEKYFRPEQTFFDVGTGTGILAIGAARIKAAAGVRDRAITGCDTDEGSIDIARENTVLNEVGDMIDLYVGSMNDDSPAADFVCANLTIDVILPLLPLLIEKTKSFLLLSGILQEQETQIVDALAGHGYTAPEIEHSGEWISVVVLKS